VDLVHEATHGWLFNSGRVDANERFLPLVERICCREQARFYKRWLLSINCEPAEAQANMDSVLSKLLGEIERMVVKREGRGFVLRPP
jgi:hypothetical protein